MVQFNSFVWCLLVFLSQSRSTVIEEHDGEEVLESVVHFHAGAQSIPAQNLSELLPLISNRSAAGEQELPQVGLEDFCERHLRPDSRRRRGTILELFQICSFRF